MRSRILLGTLFGAAGGFMGYLLQEFLLPHIAGLDMTRGDATRLGIYVGGMLGMALGAVEGAAVGSSRQIARGCALGAFVGAIGGIFGTYFGGAVYNFALMGSTPEQLAASRSILDFTHQVVARALGWTFLGAFPGLAAGAATRSPKRAIHGLMGGIIGGFVGGLIFDLVGSLITNPMLGPAASAANQQIIEVGGPSRAIGFTAIGTLTGFFIGLVEEMLKQAWVRVLAGNNEGKDYIISKAMTVIGRDERADIPVFGDPVLAAQHAAIRMSGNRHTLLDGGSQPTSVVNGQAVTEQLLRDGDMIQLGQVRLLFREKATASKIGRHPVDVPKGAQAASAVSVPSTHCQFCGAQKDAAGNCLCSVPGGPTSAPPQAYAPSAPMPSYAPPMPTPGGGIGLCFIGLDGPYAGQTFPLTPGSMAIGREPSNQMALTNDTTVSRRHGHLSEEAGCHVLYDDNSSNGTFVNGVKIVSQPLAPGDIVQFGASKYRYE